MTNEELHIILEKENPGDLEQIQVIVRYIKDKTNKDISNQSINKPTDIGNLMLMNMMYSVAKQFYLNGK